MKFINLFSLFVFFVVGIHAFVSWFTIIQSTAPDFGVYYYSAQRLRLGLSLYGDTGLFTGLGYPPQSMFLYIPLTFFPYQTAQMLWITVSFLCIPFITYLSFIIAGKKPSLSQLLLGSSLFFLLFPTKFTLGMGQVNLIALVFILCAFIFNKKQNAAGGIFLGVSLLLKPQFVFLFIYFVLIGKKRFSAVSLFFAGIITVLTVMLFGYSDTLRYLTVESQSLTRFVERNIYYNQGFSGFFSRLMSENTAQYAVQLSRLVIVSTTAAVIFLHRRKLQAMFPFFLLTMLLVLPVVWQHHFVFLFPLIIWIAGRIERMSHICVLILSIVLISINIHRPQEIIILQPFVLSHGFFGMMLLWLLSFQLFKKTL